MNPETRHYHGKPLRQGFVRPRIADGKPGAAHHVEAMPRPVREMTRSPWERFADLAESDVKVVIRNLRVLVVFTASLLLLNAVSLLFALYLIAERN